MVIFGEVPVWSQLGGPFWDALWKGSPLCGRSYYIVVPFGMFCGRVVHFVGGLSLEWLFLG